MSYTKVLKDAAARGRTLIEACGLAYQIEAI